MAWMLTVNENGRVKNIPFNHSSGSPMSDIDFFDTHDILTIFHLMQYIAIFSRYFPSVNWAKMLQNFIPGARMLTFSRQNGLFTIT